MNKETYLVYLPLVLTVLLVVCVTTFNAAAKGKASGTLRSFESTEDDSCASCMVTGDDCTSTSAPVLGGVDLVNYFVAYKLPDGSYNTSETGIAGSQDHASVFHGYTFYFSSAANKALFDANPTQYVPQWGGFCAWGVATEGCPQFAWSTDCMGPYGNWAHWSILNGKIYFFWFASAQTLFLSDPDTYIAAGDERWSGWYGDGFTTFNSNCYVD